MGKKLKRVVNKSAQAEASRLRKMQGIITAPKHKDGRLS
jgi:hypothetical protein